MQTLVRTLRKQRLWPRETAPLLGALFLAETTYKLGSFALELLAMLGTWYVLSVAAEGVRRLFGNPENGSRTRSRP